MNPNPWTGINAWREFRYDCRHPLRWFKYAVYGMRGKNPQISGTERWLIVAVVGVGVLNILIGIAAVVLG